jgi:WD40 repeat protein
METSELLKVLDAHFGRIISLEPLTIGNWNSVSYDLKSECVKHTLILTYFIQIITSSIDRTVKVWNINNIFEQVHVIDRHEVQIDGIR